MLRSKIPRTGVLKEDIVNIRMYVCLYINCECTVTWLCTELLVAVVVMFFWWWVSSWWCVCAAAACLRVRHQHNPFYTQHPLLPLTPAYFHSSMETYIVYKIYVLIVDICCTARGNYIGVSGSWRKRFRGHIKQDSVIMACGVLSLLPNWSVWISKQRRAFRKAYPSQLQLPTLLLSLEVSCAVWHTKWHPTPNNHLNNTRRRPMHCTHAGSPFSK